MGRSLFLYRHLIHSRLVLNIINLATPVLFRSGLLGACEDLRVAFSRRVRGHTETRQGCPRLRHEVCPLWTRSWATVYAGHPLTPTVRSTIPPETRILYFLCFASRDFAFDFVSFVSYYAFLLLLFKKWPLSRMQFKKRISQRLFYQHPLH